MGSIGTAEILVVLVVALLVLGPSKLPDAARSVGRAIGEFRRYTSGFQSELREAFSEPEPSYPASPSDTASVDWSPSVEDEQSAGAPEPEGVAPAPAEVETATRPESDGNSPS